MTRAKEKDYYVHTTWHRSNFFFPHEERYIDIDNNKVQFKAGSVICNKKPVNLYKVIEYSTTNVDYYDSYTGLAFSAIGEVPRDSYILFKDTCPQSTVARIIFKKNFMELVDAAYYNRDDHDDTFLEYVLRTYFPHKSINSNHPDNEQPRGIRTLKD